MGDSATDAAASAAGANKTRQPTPRAHLLQLFTARSRGGADQINAKRRAVAAASGETMTASRVLIKLNDICASLEQRQRSRQAAPPPRPAAHVKQPPPRRSCPRPTVAVIESAARRRQPDALITDR